MYSKHDELTFCSQWTTSVQKRASRLHRLHSQISVEVKTTCSINSNRAGLGGAEERRILTSNLHLSRMAKTWTRSSCGKAVRLNTTVTQLTPFLWLLNFYRWNNIYLNTGATVLFYLNICCLEVNLPFSTVSALESALQNNCQRCWTWARPPFGKSMPKKKSTYRDSDHITHQQFKDSLF